VLIASESEPTRAGVRLALEAEVTCTEAADADSAVEQAIRDHPDVCMLDLRPWSHGLRAATEIAKRLPSSAVIVFTAAPDEREFFAAIRAGATGYLPQTLDPSRLPQVVRAVLEGEAAVPRLYVRKLIEELSGRRRRRRLVLPEQQYVDLTSREWEIVELLRRGLSTQQIADELEISPVTVRRHLSTVEKKLGVTSRADVLRRLG